MRLPAHLVALFLVLPGTAAAQARPSPIPDHWLTLDSLSGLLVLTTQQRDQVSEPYAALNAVLQQAVQRRQELIVAFRGPPVIQMTPEQRQVLQDRLEAVRVEYEGRQAELDTRYTALRGLLTMRQQAKFDVLPKARLVPETPRQP